MKRRIIVGVGAVLLWACGSGPCLALSATNTVASDTPRKLDAGQWKHSVPVVVRNETKLSVSNAVTMVEIEIQDGMQPDLGDVRLTDEKGFEQPVLAANVREYFCFQLLFAVDLPAGGMKNYVLLYGNTNATRRARLNLADTALNCIPNHGFEEGSTKNPKLPAGWDCKALPPSAETGLSTNDACSGSYSMCIYAAVATTSTNPWMAVRFSLPEPLRRGEQMVHAASGKSRNLSPARGATAGTQIPYVVGVGFPQYDYDWMTKASVFTASKPAARKRVATPNPLDDADAAPTVPDAPEDDVVMFKNIGLLVGAQGLPAGGTVWYDDIFMARYVALTVDVGK
ncbi:MAG: hypothetical protein PHW60_09350 [Kiritimatiellae bacterium]|nr:hypothetical protein [Kiritimatiellia bacterium]